MELDDLESILLDTPIPPATSFNPVQPQPARQPVILQNQQNGAASPRPNPVINNTRAQPASQMVDDSNRNELYQH